MLDQLIAPGFFLFFFGRSSLAGGYVALMLVQSVLDRRDSFSSSTAESEESGSDLGLWGRGRSHSGLGLDSRLRISRLEVPRCRNRLGGGIKSGG